MYIIHEENHGSLCVAENLGKGILWLIKNDWLNGNLESWNEDDETYQLKDIVKGADKNPYEILGYLIKLGYKDGTGAVIEWLEDFGIYFREIEVA